MKKKALLTLDALRDAVNAYCQAKGISKSALAGILGIAPAVLSNLEAGKENISAEMQRRIYNVVQPVDCLEVGTTNYNTVLAVCDEARQYSRMQAVIGDAGYGKSTALRAYERTHAGVYYVVCQKSMRPKQFFMELLQKMGLPMEGSLFELVSRIAAKLNVQAAPLVLIDEAGKLSPPLLMYLVDLYNMTERRAGIVLAGVGYFKTNLDKAVARGREGMPELYSRIAAWEELGAPTGSEKRAVCEAHGLTDPNRVKVVCRARNYRDLTNGIINELTNPALGTLPSWPIIDNRDGEGTELPTFELA